MKQKYKIIYPAIDKWLADNHMTIKRFGRECCVGEVRMANALHGFRDPSQDTVDRILKVTGMTYAEAFAEG